MLSSENQDLHKQDCIPHWNSSNCENYSYYKEQDTSFKNKNKMKAPEGKLTKHKP